MFLMMQWAFESGYRRYEWKCDALNAASRAAAQRLGLSFEGVFRQAAVTKGRNRDTAWYAAIDSEWPALHTAFAAWLAPGNFDERGRQRTRLADLTRPILKRCGGGDAGTDPRRDAGRRQGDAAQLLDARGPAHGCGFHRHAQAHGPHRDVVRSALSRARRCQAAGGMISSQLRNRRALPHRLPRL